MEENNAFHDLVQGSLRDLWDGMMARGVCEDTALRIVHQLEGFASYGFPESHARTLERLAGVKAQFEYTVSMLPKMRAAGINLVLGDDYGFAMMPHGDYASEMEAYVKYGTPLIEVMQWGTRNGARAMGRHGVDLGEIQEGKLADLIVVEGDPTEDVLVFRDPGNVQLVLKNGQVEKDLLSTASQ